MEVVQPCSPSCCWCSGLKRNSERHHINLKLQTHSGKVSEADVVCFLFFTAGHLNIMDDVINVKKAVSFSIFCHSLFFDS